MKSSKKLTQDGVVTHVFDTCVWVTLANHIQHRSLAHNILRRNRIGELHFAVPEVVRDEFSAGIGKHVKRAKAQATEAADTLTWLVDAAIRHIWCFEDDGPKIKESHRDSLREILSAIKSMESDPLESDIMRAVEENFEPIPSLKADTALIGKQAIEGKAPFISKSASIADARILFSLLRFAKKHAGREFHFYTLNTVDFGSPEDDSKPHPDIASLLLTAPNVTYHGKLADLYGMQQEEAVLNTSEQAFDEEQLERQWRYDACQRCQGEVDFESVVCAGCGCSTDGELTYHECTLRPFRNGYLVDLHHYGTGRDYRLTCEHCGRKTFEVEQYMYCDYCEHMMGKA